MLSRRLAGKKGRRSTPILGRWVGLETEYAVRNGLPGMPSSNRRIFEEMRTILRSWIATRPSRGMREKEGLFMQNGGAVCYEHLPHAADGGLIEGATPECSGPSQLLLYQKAQDRLLSRCIAELESRHRYSIGLPPVEKAGDAGLGLLKNCRDADGNRYGAQENYETQIADGLSLWLYRCGLFVLSGWVLLWTITALLLTVVLVVGLIAGLLLHGLIYALVPPVRKWSFFSFWATEGMDEESFGKLSLYLSYSLCYPIAAPHLCLLQAFGFRQARREMTPFLVSRPILSGTGTVEPDGRFGLSEKGPVIKGVMRWTLAPKDRCIFDPGNLVKMLLRGLDLRRLHLGQAFGRRQRMQLGLSDSNMAQTAEFLKVGTTSLILDMMEDGFLHDGPRLKEPVKALHDIVADPSLKVQVELKDGRKLSALELQRWYLERATEYLKEASAPSMEAFQVVRMWRESLELLEQGRFDALVGRLDWVTKRALLEQCGGTGEQDVLKTLDLRYHELGNGYYNQLERQGLAPILVSEEEAEQAIQTPPENSPAKLRGQWIRRHHGSPVNMEVSWDSVHLGSRLRPKVVPFRAPRSKPEPVDKH